MVYLLVISYAVLFGSVGFRIRKHLLNKYLLSSRKGNGEHYLHEHDRRRMSIYHVLLITLYIIAVMAVIEQQAVRILLGSVPILGSGLIQMGFEWFTSSERKQAYVTGVVTTSILAWYLLSSFTIIQLML
ncbi:hypothetical protein SAMN04488134_10511 [Amphibacillus marinus]|uniref:DUF4181 domain-containing protein n=1 Tax=Amphibacillus marinus TaxID=872970 RepID=A0A1H8MV83_9BACI|nr:hypothetical protein [Amphibacillus marinus]SEO21174.1 hypothetical protein SAMN04488134_10511 [Amphibacillus marinus]